MTNDKRDRLWHLPGDQGGGVQSLSFVLTVPPLLVTLMFLVQLSQITMARMVVEYAAFAAARSAVVWIPARVAGGEEWENRIGAYHWQGDVVGEDDRTYSRYLVEPGGAKFDKIELAAAMACLSICPSRHTGASRDHGGNAAAAALHRAYQCFAPHSAGHRRAAARLENKLAYALENTRVQIEVRHKEGEPPLARHGIGPYPEEFAENEIGWQDQVLVTVVHDFALLPGPGRLLARRALAPDDSTTSTGDRVADRIGRQRQVFVYPLTATVRLGNEGKKPVLSYVYDLQN